MNLDMVKPEKFGHLCLVYHFIVPLRRCSHSRFSSSITPGHLTSLETCTLWLLILKLISLVVLMSLGLNITILVLVAFKFKLGSSIFYQIFIFQQMIALEKV